MNADFIINHPLTALFITIGSYLCAQKLQIACNNSNLLNPVAVAILIVTGYIVAFDLSYAQYLQNANLIHALLGPATVALAVPLYNQLPIIKRTLPAILGAVFICSITAAASAYGLATLMGATLDIQLAIIPKSTTTAIAIGIAEKIDAQLSLAVFFVITTGIIGTLVAAPLFKIFRVTDDKSIGLALGVASHGLGVARAFQHSEQAGTFAAIGMSLMGIVSGILLPIIVLNILN